MEDVDHGDVVELVFVFHADPKTGERVNRPDLYPSVERKRSAFLRLHPPDGGRCNGHWHPTASDARKCADRFRLGAG